MRIEHRLVYDLLKAKEESIEYFISTLRAALLANTKSIIDVPGVVDICFPRTLDDFVAVDTSFATPDAVDKGEATSYSKTTNTPLSDSERGKAARNTISYLVTSPRFIDTVYFDCDGYPLSYSQYTDLVSKREWKLLQLDSGHLSSRQTSAAHILSLAAVRGPVESFIDKALGIATGMGHA